MICPNCQTENASDSKFCIKCGTPLNPVQNTPEPQLPNMNYTSSQDNIEIPRQQFEQPINNTSTGEINFQNTINPNPAPTNESTAPTTTQKPVSKFNLVKYLTSFIKKPISAFEENEKDFSDPKNALLLSGIVALFMMLASLLKNIITVVFEIGYDDKLHIEFGMLEYLKWTDLIFKNLIVFAAVIAVVAFVYYVAGLIFKKSPNFLKLLSATASSLIPFTLLGTILATLLSYIWAPLSVIAMIIGAVATLVIFINLIDKEFTFESKDQKVFFHLICLSVILIVGYFAIMKMIESSISSSFGDLFDIFG